jgi:hypothetical protein
MVSKDLNTMKIDGLSGFLLTVEENQPTEEVEHVFSTRHRGRGRGRSQYQIRVIIEIHNNHRNLKEIHWKEAKRILRYLRGTIGYGLIYRSTKDFRLIDYTHSDWAGCMDDKKSTSGYSFNMGLATVAWSTKKKPTISLSTAEAEYKAIATTVCEAVWLRIILEDHHEQQEQPI